MQKTHLYYDGGDLKVSLKAYCIHIKKISECTMNLRNIKKEGDHMLVISVWRMYKEKYSFCNCAFV